MKLVRAFLSVVACLTICGAIFCLLLLAWSFFAAPFARLASSGPVILPSFGVATALTAVVWRKLCARKRPRRVPGRRRRLAIK